MIEQFFTQTEWQGIQFSALGVPLDPAKPAAPEFYAVFYDELMRVRPTLGDLPENWQAAKSETAAAISTLVDQNDRLLSYGAGLGYVEQCLVKEHGLYHVSVCDVAPAASHFDPEGLLTSIDTPSYSQEGGGQEFDVIIMVQVLYALERTDAIEALQNLKQMLAPGGQLILLNTSPILRENGDVHPRSLPARLRAAARNVPPLWNILRRLRRRSRGLEQGWGWSRDNDCVRAILNEAGFGDMRFQPKAGQAVVQARVGPPATL
jgi:SAM-dependent methyltransferase